MRKLSIRAEQNLPKSKSWPVEPQDVIPPDRQSRSSKPEVFYFFGDASAQELNREAIYKKHSATAQVTKTVDTVDAPVNPDNKDDGTEQTVTTNQQNIQGATGAQPSDDIQQEQAQEQVAIQPVEEQAQGLEDGQGQDELDDDVFYGDNENVNNDEDSMGEDRILMPNLFSGGSNSDADDWLRKFQNYRAYKGYDDAKALSLFKALLDGGAGIWLESLQDDVKNVLAELVKAFEERYKSPELLHYKNAREIFARKQLPNENVEDYIGIMRKLGKAIKADDKMVIYAILNGLPDHLATYTTRQKPETLDALLEAARTAEMTYVGTAKEPDLSQQMAEMREEMKKLSSKWDKVTTATVQASRSPTPERGRESYQGSDQRRQGRRVTFDDERPRFNPRGGGQFGFRRGQWRGRNGGGIANGRQNAAYGQQYGGQRVPYGTQNARPMTYYGPGQYESNTMNGQSEQCWKCGRRRHERMNLCPAINQQCFLCSRVGHFAKMCRSAARANQATSD